MPDDTPKPSHGFRWNRVLLKVSGEVLMGDAAYGIDMKTVDVVAKAVAEVAREGVQRPLRPTFIEAIPSPPSGRMSV